MKLIIHEDFDDSFMGAPIPNIGAYFIHLFPHPFWIFV